MKLKYITILLIALIFSTVNVKAQKDLPKKIESGISKDALDGRNMERVYIDESGEPYVTVTYDLDLKSNILKNGVMSAFVVATIIPKSTPSVKIAEVFEIKCDERLIRFATSSELNFDDNGKLIMGETRKLADNVFENPFTDRGMKSEIRGQYKAIIKRSCTTEL
jgi:hypothetical protein